MQMVKVKTKRFRLRLLISNLPLSCRLMTVSSVTGFAQIARSKAVAEICGKCTNQSAPSQVGIAPRHRASAVAPRRVCAARSNPIVAFETPRSHGFVLASWRLTISLQQVRYHAVSEMRHMIKPLGNCCETRRRHRTLLARRAADTKSSCRHPEF